MALGKFTGLISLIPFALAIAGCGRQVPSNHSVTVRWDASTSEVSGYRVYRSVDCKDATPKMLAVTPADATEYVDLAVEPGCTYYYTVKSFDSAGIESYPSAQVSATIPRN
jgi:fibronectin type 3 domain-containing protein